MNIIIDPQKAIRTCRRNMILQRNNDWIF